MKPYNDMHSPKIEAHEFINQYAIDIERTSLEISKTLA